MKATDCGLWVRNVTGLEDFRLCRGVQRHWVVGGGLVYLYLCCRVDKLYVMVWG